MTMSALYESFAFPWLMVDRNNSILAQNTGALFPIPDLLQENFDSKIISALPGWGLDAYGYAFYCVKIDRDTGERLIIYGLKIKEMKCASRKEQALSIKLSKTELEKYTYRFIKSLDENFALFNGTIRESIHELRGINSSLYNVGYEVESDLQSRDYSRQADLPKISNIVALSQIMKIRMDFLNTLSSDVIASAREGKFPVYRKFDKVQRCMKSFASQKGIKITLSGTSNGLIDGLKIFEVIPYLLLDNAIKYSPSRQDINLRFNDTEKLVIVSILSYGPRVEEDEIDRIFELGYRGRHAKRMEGGGTGIGLHYLKDLVENKHKGKLVFTQEPTDFSLEGIPQCKTTFHLEFPRVA